MKKEKTVETEANRAELQARAQLASIVEMVEVLRKAEESNDEQAREDAMTAIQEDPLSVELRGGWHKPGGESEDEEFRILLCTGGPACQIVGNLDEHGEPSRPVVQYQDWGTPWTELIPIEPNEREALETYCGQFYFGH